MDRMKLHIQRFTFTTDKYKLHSNLGYRQQLVPGPVGVLYLYR